MGGPARDPQVTCADRGGGEQGCVLGSVGAALGRPGPGSSVLTGQTGGVAPGDSKLNVRLRATLGAHHRSWPLVDSPPTGFLSGGASLVTATLLADPRPR